MAMRMSVWVIYDHPSDHPERFVLREWVIENGVITPSPDVNLFDTIAEARDAVPQGLVLSPVPEPDPKIVEVWM